jgi:serine/threonine protein kinase
MSNLNDFTARGYEVVRELGANRGAGRIAYLARQVNSEQLVLIKQFQFDRAGSNWDGQKEISKEIKILQQLQHPNIPRYLTSFETPHSFCIVQEYIDGKSLAEIISNQQFYTPEQVKEIIFKLLKVLVYLQKTFTDPVLHRNIKPANILIDNSCQPFLIDFGRLKVSEGAGDSTVAVGALGLMPPEQQFGQFDRTTDLYSLGMSIVCWLSRKEPTEMRNITIMGTNKVKVGGLRDLLSAYSLRLVDWLQKVIQPDPQNRYPDAEAALIAFKSLDMKPLPAASVSSSALEFTANKLGERITQIITVQNNVPDTILKGWWEVAPHPSDPPHTPNSHAWISFGSRQFSGNATECLIVVDTDKLMAGRVYQRQILLHSNSTIEVEELDLIVRTAELSIQANRLPYVNLICLFLIIEAIAVCTIMYAGEFMPIVMFLLSLIVCLLVVISIIVIFINILMVISKIFSWIAGDRDIEPSPTWDIVLSLTIIKGVHLFFPNLWSSVTNPPSYTAILPFLLIFVMFYLGGVLISKLFNNHGNKHSLVGKAVLSVFLLGISIPLIFIFLMGSQILFTLALIAASIPMVSVVIYATIKYKQLLSKYRDSQERLIKP